MSDTIVKTQNITKKYGDFTAVDTMNIEVQRGDIYALVGKNGAGKTTLLKLICGLAAPTSGELELFSQASPKGQESARSRTGSIIETPSFFTYLSAEDNLESYRIQRGIPGKKCVREALEFVGLADTGKKKFKNFSLGMKQRLGLALAIMGSPDLLILDEPINGLDPMGIAEFRQIILKLNREMNTTILISSHILGELSQIATTYGFIDSGRLIEHISAQALRDKCKRRLSVKVGDVQKAAAVMENELSCTDFEILNENEIETVDFLDTPEVLIKSLVMNGVDVCAASQVGLNLENYFINLVGGAHNA